MHQHFVDFAMVADVTGVLRHYQFVPGFRAKVEAAVRTLPKIPDKAHAVIYVGLLVLVVITMLL